MRIPIKEIFGLKEFINYCSPNFTRKYPGLNTLLAFITMALIIYLLVLPFSINRTATYITVAFIFIYFILYVLEIFKSEAILFIYGMGNTKSFPLTALDRINAILIKKNHQLSLGYDNDNLEESKKKLKKDYQTFNNLIKNKRIKKIYVAGLARIPFLTAYGTYFHSCSQQICYLERDHHENRWILLPEQSETDNHICEIESEIIEPNAAGEVALAIEFSAKINPDSMPEIIRDNVAWIRIDKNMRNYVRSKKQLHYTMDHIRSMLDQLSSNKSVKKIHLFLSVQTIVALEIGRLYQDGMHKPLEVYCYDAKINEYTYSLSVPFPFENLEEKS